MDIKYIINSARLMDRFSHQLNSELEEPTPEMKPLFGGSQDPEDNEEVDETPEVEPEINNNEDGE